MRILRHIDERLKKSIPRYIAGLAALLTVDALVMVTPKLIGHVVDLIKNGKADSGEISLYSLLIVGLALAIAVMRFGWRMFITGESRKLEYYMRNKIFSHMTMLETDFFIRKKTGDLMAHVTNDVNAVRFAFGMGLVIAADSVFVAVTTIIIMSVSIDVRLTFIAISPMVAVGTVLAFMSDKLQLRFRRVQDSFSRLTEYVQESYSGIRVIKAYSQNGSFEDGFERVNSQYKRDNISLIKVWGAAIPFVGLVTSLCMLIALFYGGRLVITEGISLGDFIASLTYIALLMWPMLSTGWIINVFHKCKASLNRINDILDTTVVKDSPNSREIDKDSQISGVEFKDVSFTYPNAEIPALKNISFKVEAGRTLGIVGRIGSGKSTIGRILIRQYDNFEGCVKVAGKEIREFKVADIRRKIACVPQDGFLFSESIKFNIGLGRGETDDDVIWESAEISTIDKDCETFENGMDTIVGERGVTLSGGQRQRVAIARALAGNGDILFFDDCLSAVDLKTEYQILKNLRTYRKSKTAIVIAHRITSVIDADEIAVLDGGMIVERGTHEELIRKGGIYKSLYDHQKTEE